MKSLFVVFLTLLTAVSAPAAVDSLFIRDLLRERYFDVTAAESHYLATDEMVAAEMTLRTLSTAGSISFLRRAGMNKDDAEVVISEALAYKANLVAWDQESEGLVGSISRDANLTRIANRKRSLLDRHLGYLRQRLDSEAWNRFRDVMKFQVGTGIQSVPILSFDSVRVEDTPSNSTTRTVFVYATSWTFDSKMFGVATVLDPLGTGAEYRARIEVSGPEGSNVLGTSEWNRAPHTYSVEPKVAKRNGEYRLLTTVELRREQRDADGKLLGLTEPVSVANKITYERFVPRVNVESVNPAALSLGGNGNGEYNVNVSVTTDVPAQTQIVIEMFETSSSVFPYSVTPSSRQKTVTVAQPGTAIAVDFVVQIDTNSTTGQGTSVTNRFRVQSVTPPQGSGVTVTAGNGEPPATLIYTGPSGCQGGSIGSCPDGAWDMCQECCVAYQGGPCVTPPILINLSGKNSTLTDLENGVLFDIDGNGASERVSWTTANSDDAWLVLDRNLNGRVDNGKELFGNFTLQPQPPSGESKNGFLALAEFDKLSNGGNSDRAIDTQDEVFSKLRLWQDLNHNGISEPSELKSLAELGLVRIEFDYKLSRRRDRYGNVFRYRAKVYDNKPSSVGRWAWDVLLIREP